MKLDPNAGDNSFVMENDHLVNINNNNNNSNSRLDGDSVEMMEDDAGLSPQDPVQFRHDGDLNDEDLPTSLIITNLDVLVFDEEHERLKFENLFREFEVLASFQYFKSFRRARVNFFSSGSAAKARIQLHQATVCDKQINCYFAQPVIPKETGSHPYLQLPAPVKQFLISPPASPPVGWEPVDEAEPVINYDLLAAIASLSPGESHELHPPSETQPGIVVHICEEEEENVGSEDGLKAKIIHTKCPERNA